MVEGPFEICKYMISPELEKRCKIYCRNDEGLPEKCWDDSMEKGPVRTGRRCPNHTGRRHPELLREVHYSRRPSQVNSEAGSVKSELEVHHFLAQSEHKVNLAEDPEEIDWEY